MKFAAIDIGSNAVRLLLSQVIEDSDEPFFKKDSLMRMPLRLGNDAFVDKRISNEKVGQLIDLMAGFNKLIRAYSAFDYLACATSAMREAENGSEIVNTIRQEGGINLEIIDGKKEAEIIYANHIEDRLQPDESYLYIDVGGGSTEITLFSNKKAVTSRSFNIGTVRLLHYLVAETSWQEMKTWLKQATKDYLPITGIGSGGNINKIFKMSRKKEGKPISYKQVKEIYEFVKSYTFRDRVRKLNLRPDRADVIVPASEIYLSVMKWAKIKEIYVPQIGLSDGLIHVLYERHKAKNHQ